jgi:hypothetical protein
MYVDEYVYIPAEGNLYNENGKAQNPAIVEDYMQLVHGYVNKGDQKHFFTSWT